MISEFEKVMRGIQGLNPKPCWPLEGETVADAHTLIHVHTHVSPSTHSPCLFLYLSLPFFLSASEYLVWLVTALAAIIQVISSGDSPPVSSEFHVSPG